MLFLAIYKCFTLREPTDHLHALIMSFFMFLACSIITSSAFYLAFLFFFIILMMLDMICLTIAREGGRTFAGFGAGLAARPLGAAIGHGVPGVWRRLILSSLAVGSIVLVLTLVTFLLLPHYTANRIPNPWVKPQDDPLRLSGFSEELNFGNLKQLKLDDSEVMKVYPVWEDGVKRPFPASLRLRGQALDNYDEAHWTTFPRGAPKESSRWDQINFSTLPASQGPVLWLRIKNQNLMNVRRLFGASMPFQFQLDQRRHRIRFYTGYGRGGQRPEFTEPFHLRLDWNTQSVQIVPTTGWGISSIPSINYIARSHLAEEAMPLLRALLRDRLFGADKNAPYPEGFPTRPDPAVKLTPEERAFNTYLPPTPFSRKLGRLSRQVAGGADEPEKIVNLMNWFYSNFEYSLTPQSAYGQHPLETFLTRSHKGHCEYFASSFVLLLRAQGIPARIATGFFSSELRDSGDATYYQVVQSDAHAWAEVWMDGFGWLTLDPTPPDWRGRVTRLREDLPLWSRLSNWTKAAWQKYVLDYSEFQQTRLMALLRENSLARSLVFIWSVAVETVKNLCLLNTDGHRPTTRELLSRVVMASLALVLAVIWLMRFIACARRQARAGAARSSVAFMNQLMQRLGALGWKRRPSQTPAEWLAEIDHKTEGRWQLGWVVDCG
jgi:hypothetical protein